MYKQLRFIVSLSAKQEGIREAVAGVRSALDSIESKAKSVGVAISKAFSFKSLAGQLSSIPGFSLLTNPYAIISGGLAAVSKIGMQAEQTSIAFKTLVGDGDRANKMLSEIAEFADRTPFNRMGLTEGAQQMLNFGVEAGKVTGYLKQLGDISGGDAGKLSSLTLAFGQVASAGKLSGQDYLQFINAGFNPLRELANMTGESFQQMKERMEKGEISTENVAQAIAHATGEGGQFHGMLEALANSGAGSFNRMMGAIQEGAIKIYEKVQPYLLHLFAVVSEYVPKVFSAIGGTIDFIIGTVSFIKEWKTPLLIVLGIITSFTVALKLQRIAQIALAGATLIVKGVTAGWAVIQGVLNAVMALSPMGWFILVVGILTTVVVTCWNKFAGFRAFLLTMWDVIKGFAGIIKDYVINRINELLGAIGNVGKAIAKLFTGDFSGAADAIGEAAKGFAGVNSATQAYNSGKSLLQGASSVYEQHLAVETAKQVVKETTGAGDKPGISTPSLQGSASSGDGESVIFGAGAGKGKNGKGGRGKTGDAIATGGTRNTQITMTIGKLIERIDVTMMDKTDTSQLDKAVLASVNRALAIATSTDR